MTGSITSKKLADLSRLQECFKIAKLVYEKDKKRYKDVYSWINKKVHQERDLGLVLKAVESLKKRAVDYNNPLAGEVFAYLEGTLRNLEEEEEGRKIRRGEFSPIGEFTRRISEALEGAKGKRHA